MLAIQFLFYSFNCLISGSNSTLYPGLRRGTGITDNKYVTCNRLAYRGKRTATAACCCFFFD